MDLTLRRWRSGHLLASWAAYWGGLAGVTLGPAARAAWRATHLPDGHGSISAGFGDGALNLTVVEEGAKTLVATAPLGSVLAWVIGPPLALWLVWLFVRSRGVDSHGARLGRDDVGQLAAGAPRLEDWRVSHDDRAPAERQRVRTPNP